MSTFVSGALATMVLHGVIDLGVAWLIVRAATLLARMVGGAR